MTPPTCKYWLEASLTFVLLARLFVLCCVGGHNLHMRAHSIGFELIFFAFQSDFDLFIHSTDNLDYFQVEKI